MIISVLVPLLSRENSSGRKHDQESEEAGRSGSKSWLRLDPDHNGDLVSTDPFLPAETKPLSKCSKLSHSDNMCPIGGLAGYSSLAPERDAEPEVRGPKDRSI